MKKFLLLLFLVLPFFGFSQYFEQRDSLELLRGGEIPDSIIDQKLDQLCAQFASNTFDHSRPEVLRDVLRRFRGALPTDSVLELRKQIITYSQDDDYEEIYAQCYFLAAHYLAYSDFDNASTYLDHAFECDLADSTKFNGAVYDLMRRAFKGLGNEDRALVFANFCVKRAGPALLPAAHNNLGMLLAERGDYNEAVANYEFSKRYYTEAGKSAIPPSVNILDAKAEVQDTQGIRSELMRLDTLELGRYAEQYLNFKRSSLVGHWSQLSTNSRSSAVLQLPPTDSLKQWVLMGFHEGISEEEDWIFKRGYMEHVADFHAVFHPDSAAFYYAEILKGDELYRFNNRMKTAELLTPKFAVLSLKIEQYILNKTREEIGTVEAALYVKGNRLTIYIILTLLVLVGLYYSNLIRNRNKKAVLALDALGQQENNLLMSIYPRHQLQSLREVGEAKTDIFEQAYLLHADFKGFTQFSEQYEAKKLVTIMNNIYTEFELLCEQNNLEKIKIDGDAFLAKVKEGVYHPAVKLINTAWAMQLALGRQTQGKPIKLTMRVGIHKGPAYGGIIGKTMLAYDLWGEGIDQCQKLEECCPVGNVLMAQVIYEECLDEMSEVLFEPYSTEHSKQYFEKTYILRDLNK